jgi:hypothetical protein
MNNCKDEINDEDKTDPDSDKPPSISSTGSTSTDSVYKLGSGEKSSKKSLEDFEILYTLGKGSFGKVVLGHNIHTHQQYAIRYVSKRFVEKVLDI